MLLNWFHCLHVDPSQTTVITPTMLCLGRDTYFGMEDKRKGDKMDRKNVKKGKSVAPERFFAIHGTPGGWRDRIDSETLVL